MSAGIQTIDLNNPRSYDLEDITRFKAKDGQKYRISFANFAATDDVTVDMSRAPAFKKAERHYIPNNGYIVSDGTEEFDRLAEDHGSKGKKMVFGTVIIVWPTNAKGKIDPSRLNDEWKAHTFTMGKDKFSQILEIHQEWNLADVDLVITCEGQQFQRLSFMNTKDNLLKNLMQKDTPEAQDLRRRLVSSIKKASVQVSSDLGRTMTLGDLKEKLGIGGGSSNLGASNDSDDLLDDLIGDNLV
jgi:hypothetical protein